MLEVMHLCVRGHVCVLGVLILPLSTIFQLDFEMVPTVVFFFHFIILLFFFIGFYHFQVFYGFKSFMNWKIKKFYKNSCYFK